MKQFDEKKLELKNTEMINNTYNGSVISAFIGIAKTFIPFVGDLTDGVIKENLSDFQNNKRKEFCEIIFSNNELITIEMVNDVEFIMEFMKTVDVVNRLSTNSKVKYLANLFKNSYVLNTNRNVDEYEEWLSRLSDLSDREIQILEFLYECDKKKSHLHVSNAENYTRESRAWELFLQEGKSRFNLNSGDLVAIISGTSRTGFCLMLNAFNHRIDSDNNIYYVTSYFRRFAEKIKDIGD